MEDWQNGGFGLYVHWPFCTTKCPYCDFNSHVSASVNQDEWKRGFLAALDLYAAELPERTLRSIYFGGGTPSLMRPDLVAAIIEAAQKHWRFANNIEITLEANPGSVEVARFKGYRSAGVNRVSLGIQALNDTDLKRLGRMHNAKDALRALEIADTVFDRTSFDLIYARQDQTLAQWEQELSTALSYNPTHMSLYQLTIEPQTVFGARSKAGKLRGLPNEDLSADMFDLTQSLCENNNLPAYEVSNHALAGMESAHNMIYWNGGDYLGIGPGAHGRLTLSGQRYATETPLSPDKWLHNTLRGSNGEIVRDALPGDERASEYLIMGLRTAQGISLDRYKVMCGSSVSQSKIDVLTDMKLVVVDNGHLYATRKGMPVLNGVIRELAFD